MRTSTRNLLLFGAGAITLVVLVKSKVDKGVNTPAKLPAGKGRVTPGHREAYMALVRKAAARHKELNVALLAGLLQHESAWDQNATSSTGAAGLGQFTGIGRAEVRRLIAIEGWRLRFRGEDALVAKLASFTKTDAFQPEIAVEAAALYLASLLQKRHGLVDAALTEYNAGGAAADAVARAGSHRAALDALKALPANRRSQSVTYVPAVLAEVAKIQRDGVA